MSDKSGNQCAEPSAAQFLADLVNDGLGSRAIRTLLSGGLPRGVVSISAEHRDHLEKRGAEMSTLLRHVEAYSRVLPMAFRARAGLPVADRVRVVQAHARAKSELGDRLAAAVHELAARRWTSRTGICACCGRGMEYHGCRRQRRAPR